jgi:hypothetical protein
MHRFRFLPIAALVLLVPWAAAAQTSGIAGVVRDTTGGVLPGVTVEADSPVMIEGTRVAVTDGQGVFTITGLRAGVYTVTYTLPGFSTFVREEIELTAGFTATANADMAVGGVEETVTVTGATAGVDIQNVTEQNVLSSERVDLLPSNKSTSGFAALTLGAIGAVQDVGGDQGDGTTGFGVHGSSTGNGRHLQDGMPMNGLLWGSGLGLRLNFVNQVAIAEVAITTRNGSAEQETGGPQLNYIPKSGGNVFTYTASLTGAGEGNQSSKLTDDLTDRGVTSGPSLKKLIDIGGGVGGPIKEDTIWFYGSARWWDTETYQPGAFFQDKEAPEALGGLLWVASDRQAFEGAPNRDVTGRVTFQWRDNHRFMVSSNFQDNCFCLQGVSATRADTATIDIGGNSSLTQFTWSNARSNSLLLEGGFTGLWQTQQPRRPDNVSTTDIAVIDNGIGLAYNARADSAGNILLFAGLVGDTLAYVDDVNFSQINGRFAASYVTGSHAFKAGIYFQKGWQGSFFKFNDPPLRYSFTNQVPVSLRQWADPVSYRSNLDRNIGLFAQDQWTLDRVTLNLGLRFDSVVGSNPAHSTPAGRFVGARDFPAVKNVPNFKDISPRAGVAFDVRGDGRTAIKANIGRYVASETTNIAGANNPAYQIVLAVDRTWNDLNGNYVPDCNLDSPFANAPPGGDECGATNGVLGDLTPVNRWSDDVLSGWGNRGYSWQGSVTFEQELSDNLTMTAGYYRTWNGGNNRSTDNLLVDPSNYTPYTLTTPSHPDLPGGGGQQLTNLADLDPTALALGVDNVVTQTSNFGDRTDIYNGFDVALNARFGDGGFAQGGVSSGQTVLDNCVTVDSPQLYNCKTTNPWANQTQLKVNASYPLPYDVLVSAVLQHMPGPAYGANGIFFGGEGLNRGFSSGFAFVNMMEPFQQREDRFTQLDMRFSKIFAIGGGRIRVDFDLFNITNSRAILSVSSTYGAVFGPNSQPGAGWRFPTNVLGGRMWRFGTLIDF